MTEKEMVKGILSSALDADEQGDIEKAVKYYSKAVEVILKISDPALRERLNKYAVQALDRAEELRGISSPTHKAQSENIDEGHASDQRVQSTFKFIKKSKMALNNCVISFGLLGTHIARPEADHKPVPKPRTSGAPGYTEDEKRVLNHTSNINANIFVPFMDVDLRDRFVFSIQFTDKVRLSINLSFDFICVLIFFGMDLWHLKNVFFLVGWTIGVGTETKTRFHRMAAH